MKPNPLLLLGQAIARSRSSALPDEHIQPLLNGFLSGDGAPARIARPVLIDGKHDFEFAFVERHPAWRGLGSAIADYSSDNPFDAIRAA